MEIFQHDSDFWDSGLKVITECGKVPKDMVIYIKPVVKRKIDILMNKYQNREWLSYLVGKNNIIDDIVFPKQTASSTSVGNIEFPSNLKEKIIGVIHSHHNMGSFFSGTDHEYINSNHDISIVVSKNGFACNVRWDTPCGGKIIVKAKVKIYLHTNFNEEEFVKDVEEKMEIPIFPGHTAINHFSDRHNESSFENGVIPSLKERLEAAWTISK